MPFFGDIETRDEARGPIWGPFATIRDSVERLVAVNLGWSAQLLPGVLALAFPQLPFWLRIVMGLYSATITIPATGALYALALAATRGEHVSLELALLRARELAVPSFRILSPLYGLFGVLIWSAVLIGPAVPAAAMLATFAALLWYLCATYWGPLLVCDPDRSALFVAGRAAHLVWRRPAETLATALVAAIALVIGMVSIGGLFLIVPVVIALLHTRRYLDVAGDDGAIVIQE